MLKCVEDSKLPYSQRHDFKPVFEYQKLDVSQPRWFKVIPIQGSIYCATCGLVYADTSEKNLAEKRFKQLNEAQDSTAGTSGGWLWRRAQDITDEAQAL